MIGFGEKLRREREMRGVSLEEIAESTKIGTRSLRALEEDDFDKLPGGIFNKGFVRAYSRFLGLDEEQTVADFDVALKEYNAANGRVEEFPVESEPEPENFRGLWLATVAIVLMVAIAAGGYFLIRRVGVAKAIDRQAKNEAISQSPSLQAPAPAASPSVPIDSKPVPPTSARQPKPKEPSQQKPGSVASATVGNSDSTLSTGTIDESTSASTKSPIRLLVFAREDSWLSVSADGRNLGQQTLAAQESRTINAQKEVRLKLGNVGGVEVSFNGKPVNIDGEPRQVKEFTFTPDGLHQ